MIKQTELRMGNLVHSPNSEELKCDYSDFDLSSLEVKAIMRNYATLAINQKFSEAIYLKFIEPIPITEEWLLRFGFERKERGKFTKWKIDITEEVGGVFTFDLGACVC